MTESDPGYKPSSKLLDELLHRAANHKMTPAERLEQKVSFVYGQMMDCNPSVTKEQVRKQLHEFDSLGDVL